MACAKVLGWEGALEVGAGVLDRAEGVSTGKEGGRWKPVMGTLSILRFMIRALGNLEGFHVGVGGVAVERRFHVIKITLARVWRKACRSARV